MSALPQRTLAITQTPVSALALGTAALGLDYGIAAPGQYGRLADADALAVLQAALKASVSLFDTAPGYGTTESLVGRVLRESFTKTVVATKLAVPRDAAGNWLRGAALTQAVEASLAACVQRLQRQPIDIVQVHVQIYDPALELLQESEFVQVLRRAQQNGTLRLLGASVYTEEEALAALDTGFYQVLQVPLNVLDRRMTHNVLPRAARDGVTVLVRSALLKGALTRRALNLPDKLMPIKRAACDLLDHADGSWQRLTQLALRYCLYYPGVTSVLHGARSTQELQEALDAAAAGPLTDAELNALTSITVSDERLLNPSSWGIP